MRQGQSQWQHYIVVCHSVKYYYCSFKAAHIHMQFEFVNIFGIIMYKTVNYNHKKVQKPEKYVLKHIYILHIITAAITQAG